VKIASSRLTRQGQVSIPAEVRRRLGLSPGSSLDWTAEGDAIRVSRAGAYTSPEIHAAIFGNRPPRRVTVDAMDAAIAAHLVEKHARR